MIISCLYLIYKNRDKTVDNNEYEGSDEILTLEEVLFAGELEEQK